MKPTSPLPLLLLLSPLLGGCASSYSGLERAPAERSAHTIPASIDPAELPPRVAEDAEGMAAYWFGLIRRGPNWSAALNGAALNGASLNGASLNGASAELQAAHLANIGRLAGEGQLVLAGPFDNGDGDLRGIFVFDVATRAEAEALVASDPAVQAGRLVVDLLPWFGTARLRDLIE